MAMTVRIGAAVAVAVLVAGCSSLKDHRGYIVDEALTQSVQPGVDNQTSVAGTLGQPTFASQFGPTTWYYISSTTTQKPFTTPKIRQHSVLTVKFDQAGNVTSATRSGIEKIEYLHPDGDSTPTLGKERGFFEDLFGNIGQVGSFSGAGGADQGSGPNGS